MVCFVYGHSLGGLLLTSYLINNPNLEIAGVILSAPWYGLPVLAGMTEFKKFTIRKLEPHMKEFIMTSNINLHTICRDYSV